MMHSQKIFVKRRKRTCSKLPEQPCDWKKFFYYLKKIPSFVWRISGNFKLRFANLLCFKVKRILKNEFLMRKRTTQPSCHRTFVIWRNFGALDWRFSGNFYIWLWNFQYFHGNCGNQNGNLPVLTKYN